MSSTVWAVHVQLRGRRTSAVEPPSKARSGNPTRRARRSCTAISSAAFAIGMPSLGPRPITASMRWWSPTRSQGSQPMTAGPSCLRKAATTLSTVS